MRNYNILSYFNMRALFMGIGISKLLTLSQEYTIISLFIGTILGSIFLYFYKSSNNKSIINVIVSSIYIMLSLMILINMISSHYLSSTPKILVGIPLLLLMLYMGSKSKKVLYRLSNILIVLNILIFILAVISLVPYFNINSFNYTNTGIGKILLGSLYYMLLSISPTLVIKDNNVKIVKTYIISSITLGIWLLLTYGILGSDLIGILRYPEYVILKNVNIGGTIENIENIVSFMWMIDVIILMFSSIISIKDNLKNSNYVYLIISIVFIIVTVINMDYYILDYIYKYVIILISILFFSSILANKKTH